ncbi:MAG TPA: glycosyltransferase family 39 protein, partial [Blastocatellia bacterium]|nr:glycosyltransferase family 39 protein [Blastocatellia bacterium]
MTFLILASSTVAWTLADRTPPSWDPCHHIVAAYDYYRPLAHFDLRGFRRELFEATHYYAPFIHLVTAAIFLIFGASRLTGIAVNLISLAVLLGSVYWIGESLYGRRRGPAGAGDKENEITRRPMLTPGVVAALLSTCYHFPAWLLHDAFLDYPLMAMVTLSFALLIRAGEFRHRRHALMFGVAAGFGMLSKQTFAFFFVLPALYVTVRALGS